MSKTAHPKPPEGLDKAGKGLWTRMHDALGEGLRFSVKELELLYRACRLADREAALSAVVDEHGMTIEGSTGQTVLHPGVGELRLIESALCGLLARISTEDTAGKPETVKQQRARKAADARWGLHREQEARRLARG